MFWHCYKAIISIQVRNNDYTVVHRTNSTRSFAQFSKWVLMRLCTFLFKDFCSIYQPIELRMFFTSSVFLSEWMLDFVCSVVPLLTIWLLNCCSSRLELDKVKYIKTTFVLFRSQRVKQVVFHFDSWIARALPLTSKIVWR